MADARKKRDSAKDVVNYIGYNKMYQDGICEVEEGIVFLLPSPSMTPVTTRCAMSSRKPCSPPSPAFTTSSVRIRSCR